MKKFITSSTVLIILFISGFNNDFAQELSHGNSGFSAAFNSVQGDILIPVWIDTYNSIAPSIGVVDIENSYTDFILSLVYHHYIRYKENFSPFLGLRGGAFLGTPKSGTVTTDYLIGICAGGEYFFSPNFSAGIEAQLNITFSNAKSNRFGNPGGKNINTGSVIFAAVYF